MAMKKQSKKSSQAEGKKGLIEVRCGKIVIRAKKISFNGRSFMVYADQQNQDSSASQEQDLYGLFLIVIIFEELK